MIATPEQFGWMRQVVLESPEDTCVLGHIGSTQEDEGRIGRWIRRLKRVACRVTRRVSRVERLNSDASWRLPVALRLRPAAAASHY